MGGITLASAALCDAVIAAADTFIAKVESGRARSVATYSDMKNLKAQAELLKDAIAAVNGGPVHE